MKTYYKIVVINLDDGAGSLGYEELFGNECRYYWTREAAEDAERRFNATSPKECQYLYGFDVRHCYADGTWDDSDDQYAREQLGL